MTEDLKKQILIENTSILNQLVEDGHKPMILCLGGSHAYGTNVEGSDIDVRGVYLNSIGELLGICKHKEQYTSNEIDTVMYSFKKAVWLLSACNPVVELLACRDEDYIYLSEEGKMFKKNLSLFLSKKAAKTFGGYAKSQLNRLINRSGKTKERILENEERSFEKDFLTLTKRHKNYIPGSASIERTDSELLLSFSVDKMPVHEVINLLNEFNSIDRGYRKSVRNDKATTRGVLSKHMMHLIRLYMMGIELMKTGEIHTYRGGNEHDLLMTIREGKYLEDDGLTPTMAFEELVSKYSLEFEKSCEDTNLPDEPDTHAINRMVIEINQTII